MTGRPSRKMPRRLIEGVCVSGPGAIHQEQPWMAIMERLDRMEARMEVQQQSQTEAVPTLLGNSVVLGLVGGQPTVEGAVAGLAGGHSASAVLSPAVVLSQAQDVPSGHNSATASSTNLAITDTPCLLESINLPNATQAFGRKPGAGLNHKIKVKIWANEYEEFCPSQMPYGKFLWMMTPPANRGPWC